jgi:tetratricopeptide (TPR) repeat protein
MEKHRCKPSLTRCPFRGRNCCRPRSAGHKSSSDTHHDEEPVVRSSAYFYTSSDPTVQRSTWPQQPSGTKATHVPKAKKVKQSLFDDPAFAKGYREAYATIYDRNEYAAAIEQLRTLGHDDHPNVANLIGYSYRKLGDYKLSQVWYERALKADPNHC